MTAHECDFCSVDVAHPDHPLLCAMRVAADRVERELRRARDEERQPHFESTRNSARSRVAQHLERLDARLRIGGGSTGDRYRGTWHERAALLTAWGK